MKAKVIAVDRHPFEQNEPKIERIKLRPLEPGPVQEIVFTGCDSSEFAGLAVGHVLELTCEPEDQEPAAELPEDLEAKEKSLAEKFKALLS
jgi:fructoselysine-6-P-deglycase FrlB-like protein